jgi:hypothetical protein
MSDLVDFGAPGKFGAHHFLVEIPPGPRDAVSISEDFGFEGDTNQREKIEPRALVARELWTKIRDEARRDFNLRLKEKNHKPGSWNAGRTRLDRFLGKELCVLAWAVEHAAPDECPIICQKWLALRPEERWWLYTKTAAGAGRADDGQRGWRKALYCALSDATGISLRSKVKPKVRDKDSKKPDLEEDSLFDFIEKGNI